MMVGQFLPTRAGDVLKELKGRHGTDCLPKLSKKEGIQIATLQRWKDNPEFMVKPGEDNAPLWAFLQEPCPSLLLRIASDRKALDSRREEEGEKANDKDSRGGD